MKKRMVGRAGRVTCEKDSPELERRRNSFPQFLVNKDTCLQEMLIAPPIRYHHVELRVPRKDKNEAWDHCMDVRERESLSFRRTMEGIMKMLIG